MGDGGGQLLPREPEWWGMSLPGESSDGRREVLAAGELPPASNGNPRGAVDYLEAG